MGWLEDKAEEQARLEAKGAPVTAVVEGMMTTTSSASTDEATNVCPKCGASGTDPCLTPAGKVAKNSHSGRGE